MLCCAVTASDFTKYQSKAAKHVLRATDNSTRNIYDKGLVAEVRQEAGGGGCASVHADASMKSFMTQASASRSRCKYREMREGGVDSKQSTAKSPEILVAGVCVVLFYQLPSYSVALRLNLCGCMGCLCYFVHRCLSSCLERALLLVAVRSGGQGGAPCHPRYTGNNTGTHSISAPCGVLGWYVQRERTQCLIPP